MLGWINDCVEKLVLAKFSLDAWHAIKEKAGCKVEDGGFYKLDAYPDKMTVDLVLAAVEVSGLSAETILETFGAFFVQYVRDEGYDNLLRCQGSNLKDFMANINAMHQHLQNTFPNKMKMPQFWVEDDLSGNGTLLLHYHSQRGSLLAPVAKGVVCEIASDQFGYEINMERLSTQGEDGAEHTSWKISTVDPQQMWKLTMKDECKTTNASCQAKQMKCPFTGMTAEAPSHCTRKAVPTTCPGKAPVPTIIELPTCEESDDEDDIFFDCMEVEEEDHDDEELRKPTTSLENTSATDPISIEQELSVASVTDNAIGLSGKVTKNLFPYHVMVDLDLNIAQVGNKMPALLQRTEDELVGERISDFLAVAKPTGIEWSWKWLRLLEDQAFDVQPVKQPLVGPRMSFKTTIVHVSERPCLAMLVLTPDANNLQELRDMEITFSDLPIHGAHRESILLREHLSSQINSTARMEKLSHSLEKEKMLLESMLPHHAAEGLRQGKTVEPMMHKNVTFFFSDIVNFTQQCDKLYPWQVIEMLNRLYCVMDFLAAKFNIYKLETVGDAYVCASGLPLADEDHARNIANFAIAVNHCCRHVLSPLDGLPLQLRIGIHSGSCASGVVGTTRPQFCVFGDSVNTTARHESSGQSGKVHCSSTTRALLESQYKGSFLLRERGLVSMKGKGELPTWWLEGVESNVHVNSPALTKLDEEIKDLLSKTNFKTNLRKEFESLPPVDIAAEIKNERMRRFTILSSFPSTTSSSVGSFAGDDSDMNHSSSAQSYHGIQPLRPTCIRRATSEHVPIGRPNFSSWASQESASASAASKVRAGNSLLDAVDRSQVAFSEAFQQQWLAPPPVPVPRRSISSPFNRGNSDRSLNARC